MVAYGIQHFVATRTLNSCSWIHLIKLISLCYQLFKILNNGIHLILGIHKHDHYLIITESSVFFFNLENLSFDHEHLLRDQTCDISSITNGDNNWVPLVFWWVSLHYEAFWHWTYIYTVRHCGQAKGDPLFVPLSPVFMIIRNCKAVPFKNGKSTERRKPEIFKPISPPSLIVHQIEENIKKNEWNLFFK